jgi:polyisoprenyl-phosphate glycosyltransferase
MTEKRVLMAVRLGIVVPCFNEEKILNITAERLLDLLDKLTDKGILASNCCLCFVDDGSTDSTWSIIENIAKHDTRVHGLKLSRNQGHQVALLAGLLNTKGEALVSIDADLQDDIDVIEKMIALYKLDNDIVYGIRSKRPHDSAQKKLSAEMYYRFMKLLGADIRFNHADFRLMSRRAVDSLSQFSEVNLFLRGIVPLLGYQTESVYYSRQERIGGKSKYSINKMLALAIDGITSFSVVPLRTISALGLIVCLFSFLMIIWIVIGKIFYDSTLPGWASAVIPIYFLGGIQLVSIGILGEYIAKTYLEAKRRPRFFVEQSI